MSNQEILEKAISRAIENGWNPKTCSRIGYGDGPYKDTMIGYDEAFIFNHDFARALFGDDRWSVDPTGWHLKVEASKSEEQAWFLAAWEYHLQQLVIAPDPIAYLEEHL